MFTSSQTCSRSDRVILRAARMAVLHHPSIPVVRPAPAQDGTVGRFISTRFTRNIAPAVSS